MPLDDGVHANTPLVMRTMAIVDARMRRSASVIRRIGGGLWNFRQPRKGIPMAHTTTPSIAVPRAVSDLLDAAAELAGCVGDPDLRELLAHRCATLARTLPDVIGTLRNSDVDDEVLATWVRAALDPYVRQMLDRDHNPIHRVRPGDTWGVRCAPLDCEEAMLTWFLVGATGAETVRSRGLQLLEDLTTGTTDAVKCDIGPLTSDGNQLDRIVASFSGNFAAVRKELALWDPGQQTNAGL